MPLLDAGAAAEVARHGVLLDARAPERFRGESEPVDPVAGHIPGAVNVPATSLVDASGRFLDADALRARFAGAGVREGIAVGAYCGSGVAAAHEVLALSLAGIPAALYVGSWSDWITDPGRPVATGAPSASDHARADGSDGGLNAVLHLQLDEDARHMVLDRVLAEIEHTGDFRVIESGASNSRTSFSRGVNSRPVSVASTVSGSRSDAPTGSLSVARSTTPRDSPPGSLRRSDRSTHP